VSPPVQNRQAEKLISDINGRLVWPGATRAGCRANSGHGSKAAGSWESESDSEQTCRGRRSNFAMRESSWALPRKPRPVPPALDGAFSCRGFLAQLKSGLRSPPLAPRGPFARCRRRTRKLPLIQKRTRTGRDRARDPRIGRASCRPLSFCCPSWSDNYVADEPARGRCQT